MLTASSLDAHSPYQTQLPAAPAFPVIEDLPPNLTKAFLWDSGVDLPICLVHWFTVSEGRVRSAAGTEVQEVGCTLKGRETSA